MSVIISAPQGLPASNTFFDNTRWTALPENWRVDGIEFNYGPCSQPTLHTAVICVDDEVFDYDNAVSPSVASFRPFRLRQIVTCNPKQYANDSAGFMKLLTDAIDTSAHTAMARAFWDGHAGVDGWTGLKDLPVGSYNSTPVSAAEALSYLQKRMASTGGGSGGTIHMETVVVNQLIEDGLVYRRGQFLYTTLGDFLVIADGGYSGDGPGVDASATRSWMYATGPVQFYIGPTELAAGMDIKNYMNRKANSLTVPAEVDAMTWFDPCSWFGALVDLQNGVDVKGSADSSAARSIPFSDISIQGLAANSGRKGVILTNTSNGVAYLQYGSAASTTSFAARIDPNERWEMPSPIYTGVVYAIFDAGTSSGGLIGAELS